MEGGAWQDASYGQKLNSLSDRFRRIQKIADLSDSEHDEASAIAFALVEIEEAAREISQWSEQLAQIDRTSDTELLERLWDMGDMLRQFLSHARSARFFSVYIDEMD